ncbi:MAG: hypothetical protein V4596_07395 [Bdellovibrionota bacterium]
MKQYLLILPLVFLSQNYFAETPVENPSIKCTVKEDPDTNESVAPYEIEAAYNLVK